jgi:hypothetical protein
MQAYLSRDGSIYERFFHLGEYVDHFARCVKNAILLSLKGKIKHKEAFFTVACMHACIHELHDDTYNRSAVGLKFSRLARATLILVIR